MTQNTNDHSGQNDALRKSIEEILLTRLKDPAQARKVPIRDLLMFHRVTFSRNGETNAQTKVRPPRIAPDTPEM